MSAVASMEIKCIIDINDLEFLYPAYKAAKQKMMSLFMFL